MRMALSLYPELPNCLQFGKAKWPPRLVARKPAWRLNAKQKTGHLSHG